MEGIFVVEIKTKIYDGGKGELERGCLVLKNYIETVVGRKLCIFSSAASIRAWC